MPGAASRMGWVGLLLLWLGPTPSLAWEREFTTYGARHHHASAEPISFHIGSPVPGLDDGGRAAITAGLLEWMRPECTAVRFSPSEAAIVDVRHVAAGAWQHDRAMAAYTVVEADPSTGVIRHATLELNGAFRFTTSVPLPSDALDLHAVVTHEAGHALGFGHALHRASVMFGGFKPGQAAPRQLLPDDVEGLCAVYPARPRETFPPRRAGWLGGAIVLSTAVVWVAWRKRRKR